MPQLTLAETMRSLREQRGLKLREAARLMDVSCAFLCKIEKGDVKNCGLDIIQRATHAYKVNFLVWLTVKVVPRKNRHKALK